MGAQVVVLICFCTACGRELKMKIVYKAYNPVAIWQWEVDEVDCIICHMPFDASCPDCKMPGANCAPAWGQCGHYFHAHCIEKWSAEHRQCPMCRGEWKPKK